MTTEINLLRLSYARVMFNYGHINELINLNIPKKNVYLLRLSISILSFLFFWLIYILFIKNNPHIYSEMYFIYGYKLVILILYFSGLLAFSYAFRIFTLTHDLHEIIRNYNKEFMINFIKIDEIFKNVSFGLKVDYFKDKNGVSRLSPESAVKIDLFLASQD